MDAFIFRAALICTDCSHCVQGALIKPNHVDMHDESSYDSDEWPKGPYPYGGGEADTPQHCDMCGAFLDNALTGDGETYVRDAFREFVDTGRGNLEVLGEWKNAYRWVWLDYADITFADMVDDGNVSDLQQRRFYDLESL